MEFKDTHAQQTTTKTMSFSIQPKIQSMIYTDNSLDLEKACEDLY